MFKQSGGSLRLGWLLATLALGWVTPGLADDPRIDERKAAILKAAYLRYIAEFTIWPPGAFETERSAIVIGVLGEDPHGVGEGLGNAIREKHLQAQKRPIELRVFASGPGKGEPRASLAEQIRRCHVLFVTRSERRRWVEWQRVLAASPTVTVSEIEGFSTAGGMIEFVVAGRQSPATAAEDLGLDLYINLATSHRADLRFRSHFLSLRRGVKIIRESDDPEPAGEDDTTPSRRRRKDHPVSGRPS